MTLGAAVVVLVASCGNDTTADDDSAGDGWGPLAVVESGDSSMDALISGVLVVTDDCVLLDEQGELTLLVWPAERTSWNTDTKVVSLESRSGDVVELRNGDTVRLSGGGSSVDEGGLAAEEYVASIEWTAEPAASCVTDTRWAIGDDAELVAAG